MLLNHGTCEVVDVVVVASHLPSRNVLGYEQATDVEMVDRLIYTWLRLHLNSPSEEYVNQSRDDERRTQPGIWYGAQHNDLITTQ